MHLRGIRLAQAVLAALLVVPLVAAGEGAGSTSSGTIAACDGHRVDGRLVVVEAPDFPQPPASVSAQSRGGLVDLAVDPTTGSRAWVTDGWSIARTDDAGCTWEVVYSLDDTDGPVVGAAATDSAIRALAVPNAPGASARLYALVQDLQVPNASARFRVLVTEDSGRTFDMRGNGINQANLAADADACGDDRPCGLIATSAIDVLYVRFSGPGGTVLLASADGGRNFESRLSGVAYVDQGDGGVSAEVSTEPPLLTDLEVDPAEPNRLWGTSASRGPATSLDGGRTFTRIDTATQFELELDDIRHLSLASAGPSRIITVAGKDAIGNTRTAYSVDDGTTFRANRVFEGIPGDATGLLVTERAIEVLATTDGVFVAGAQPKPLRVAGKDHGGLRHLQTVRQTNLAAPEVAWALDEDEIVAFVLDVDPPEPQVESAQAPIDLGAFNPLDAVDPLGDLTGPISADLAPDQVVDLPFVLDVPPAGIPLDLFFLLDETGSMQDEFDALAGGVKRIVEDLRDLGVDVYVGLGTYGNGRRYHRYRKIGPPDADFLRELEAIRTGGDGEVAYTALHQVVTGTGLPRSRAGAGPRAGKDAEWRANTVRMIIHATDEGLSVEPEGPSIAEAIDALVASGAQHLGLIANEVSNGLVQTQYDWEPMFDLARVTGALAPPGGIDCNRDGIIDVQPGEPIACYLSPLTTNQTVSQADRVDLIPDFATVIVAMLRGVSRHAPITFHISDSPMVVGFAPDVPTNQVDLRRRQVIPATATVRCTAALAGTEQTLRLTATSGTRFLGSAMTTVSCGVREAAVVAGAPSAPARAAVAVAQAPAAPPVPIQAPAQAAAQAQSAAQANSLVPQVGAAAAQQEQHQVQAAGIGRDGPADQPDVAFQFSSRRDRDPAGVTLGAGVVMAVGAAALARRRRGVGAVARAAGGPNRWRG